MELLEETHIVLEEVADVIDTVAKHRNALDAHTESVAAVLLGIDAIVLEDRRIDHAATENLEPTRAFADAAAFAAAESAADIHLGRRLGEGEIGWAETDLDVGAEHLLSEIEEHLLEIGEGDILGNIEALDLMENAVRTSRNGLIAEDAAREDGTDRGLLALHLADLDRTGVGAKEDIGVGVDEERILHIAGGMLWREIEGREDMPIILDLGALGNSETEAAKNLHDLILHE